MHRKLFYLVCLALVLRLVMTVSAKAELVGWWKFDEGSGDTATDSSGNEFDIPLLDHLWADGVFGGAVHFPGQGQGQRGGFVYSDNAITVCTWVWHEAFTANQVERYVTAEPEIAVIRKESDGRLHFYINAGGSLQHLRVSDVLTEGQWLHVAGTWDGTTQRLYLDGVEIASQTPGGVLGTTSGVRLSNTPEPLNGMLDDARIYNRALTQEEIVAVVMGGENLYAFDPSPADGALYGDTWVSLSWKPGTSAVSHDIYLGDNFYDVNDGMQDSYVFRGNQGLGMEFYIAGFAPYAYPEGLVNGTTYYWRIDEVNDADPNSPWKGDIWCFRLLPLTAWNPSPADGSKNVSLDQLLTWESGAGAKFHYVYFGENFEYVYNAVGGTPRATSSYYPGPLKFDKTYYWRVDESDGYKTHKGPVWNFTTRGVRRGVTAEYFGNMNLTGNPILTRTEGTIDFNWGEDIVVVGRADNVSARFTAYLEVPYSDTYRFIVTSDDGVRLWIDDNLVIDNWTDHSPTDDAATMYMVGGLFYKIRLEWYENTGGAVIQLSWESPSVPRQIIPEGWLEPPDVAKALYPRNGANNVSRDAVLIWTEGDKASQHDIYFGTNADAVANANKSWPEYKGTRALGDESYDPGKLEGFTQYYWRIDEVNNLHPDSPWIGSVWNFTTAHNNIVVIDDFESYTDNDAAGQAIWQHWIDGFANPDNGGSQVGYDEPPYMETKIVFSGFQSMPFTYGLGNAEFSEATLTLSEPIEWTGDVELDRLIVCIHGDPGNDPGILYIRFENHAGNVVEIQNDNSEVLTDPKWNVWEIMAWMITDQGMNLMEINKVSIGVRTSENYIFGGGGKIFANRVRNPNAEGQVLIDALAAFGLFYGVVTGTVYDKDDPVSGAMVEYTKTLTGELGDSSCSDSRGFYSIFTEYDDYTATATKKDYSCNTLYLTLSSSYLSNQDFDVRSLNK